MMKRMIDFSGLKTHKKETEKMDSKVFRLNDNSTYSSVQCIASEIGTTNEGKSYDVLTDEKKDLNERCNFVQALIEEAGKSEHINNNHDCLKVFMLPEFFFRGPKGGYSLESSQEIVNNLRKMVNSPEYKDWLFVFGTTVAYSKNLEKSDESLYEAYNYSFVQMGNGKEKDSLIVMKEHKSPVDFISQPNEFPDKTLHHHNTSYMEKVSKGCNRRNEEKQINYDGNSIFEVGGLRVGLDICLDNSRRRLDNTISDKPLDAHLVTSGGLIGTSRILKWKKDGILFHCDGLSPQIGSLSSVSFNKREKSIYKRFKPSYSKVFIKSPKTNEPVGNFTGNLKVLLNVYPSYKLPYKVINKEGKMNVEKEKRGLDLSI